jgi:CheY-like chemotaxis protein
LIVDDDLLILKVIRSYLKDDYKVYCLRSGEEAISFFTKKRPDLVLLDYMMPEMDGLSVLRWMRAEETTKDIPVFFMTAVTDKKRVMECLELKPQQYLVKPVSKDELLERLSDFFEK